MLLNPNLKRLKFYYKSLSYLINRFVLKKEFLTAKAIHGILLQFKTEDAVGRFIYKHGIYEPCITSLVKSLDFNEGDVIIDVGAHIGWYSILIDKISPYGVKIFSFEPDFLNFNLLKRNLTLNKAFKVVPINKAVGEKRKKAKLYLYPDKNRGRHSLLPLHNYGFVKVDVETLDNFVKDGNIKKIKLLKVDVEGYEFFVIKGGLNALKVTENIILEYAPQYMLKGGVNINDFKSLLKLISTELNFKVFAVSEESINEIKVKDLPNDGEPINLFLTKKAI